MSGEEEIVRGPCSLVCNLLTTFRQEVGVAGSALVQPGGNLQTDLGVAGRECQYQGLWCAATGTRLGA